MSNSDISNPQAQPVPEADPADVATIDDILRACYEVISYAPGAQPDWDRLRSLFAPGARLIPPKAEGETMLRVLTVEEFIEWAKSYFEQNVSAGGGFYETDVSRRMESFGSIAHVFSTYESRHTPEDELPFQRGINSIQLWNDGARWWVVTIFWDQETQQHPIPARYL